MTGPLSRPRARRLASDPRPARTGRSGLGSVGRRRWALLAARIVVAAGLAIDGYVHLNLASTYAEGGGVVSEGLLFRAEAAAALMAAIAVSVTSRRFCYLAGFAVAVSALAVMLVSRYADLGAIGPFPDLYDPVWFPEKLLAALSAVLLCRRREERS